MMKNADMPAMPIEGEFWVDSTNPKLGTEAYLGLTKYEEILARFMSAMLSNPDMRYDAKGLFDDAKLYADAYFENLETKNPA
ncbi:hypothetical protein [Vibrio metschnikovii]|uniref:hypothetical protein n=1 Tax=Vibrio metschnikovii TaxID=28172 RepID=UPI0013024B06|nr:hypothetical protein [Vibrio metschnikovii]